ncbi:MAG: type II toxin-antitoxin system VapC family toxin [Candidatus Omnitrophica bacterium]|nr:type II toxin-antitoxin system VapC family toxin [Candidatus Omnitrophota bacterium]
MKAFIDTSALLKRYTYEKGSHELYHFLESVSEIVVAPVVGLEIASALKRKVREKIISPAQSADIFKEFQIDLFAFQKVNWSELLVERSIKIINKHEIKTLDSIQLASGYISEADIFVTSDKILAEKAKKELKKVEFI